MIANKRFSTSSDRNKAAILQRMKFLLPSSGTVLEVASGTGQHAIHMATQMPGIKWQPTNLEADQLLSVEAWMAEFPLTNILSPLLLNACDDRWPVESAEYEAAPVIAVFNANMIHISPWEVCLGLINGAGRLLRTGGKLFLYGPYKIDGQHTAPSNLEFEGWLNSLNPEFGVRDIADVAAVADSNGLTHIKSYDMPMNNFFQVFEKR
jgi:cyclopropane fatty-acyl-phospholipid synthase-like methyltransferase